MNDHRRRSKTAPFPLRVCAWLLLLGALAWVHATDPLQALAQPATARPTTTAVPTSPPATTATPSARPTTSAAIPSARPPTSALPFPGASAAAPPSASVSAPPAPPEPPEDPPPPVAPPRPTATVTAEVSAAPPVSAEPVPEPPPPEPKHEPPAVTPHDVKLLDQVVFVLRTDAGDATAERRAKDAARALKEAATDATPDDVHVEILSSGGEDVAVVYVRKTPIVQLTAADARAAQDATLAVHADSVASAIRNALRKEKDRTILANRVFSFSLVIFFAVAMFYIVRKVADFAERANAFLDAHPERVPAFRLGRMEVINPAALRSGLVLAVSLGKWVAQIGIIYVWLVAVLSLFEATRGYTERLTGFILEPFAAIAGRLAASFPVLLLVGLALIAIAILLRVIGIFFQGVAQGTTTLSWLPAELAKPTSLLIRASVILFFLVFVAPLLSGNAEGALARAGWIALLALGVATVPLLASTVVGVTVLFGRRAQPGDFVELGRHAGRVVEVTLVDVVLEDETGVELHVPHLAWLTRPAKILGAAPRVTVRATLPRAELTPAMSELLLAKASELGAEPRLEIEAIAETTVGIALSVLSDELGARARLNAMLWSALTDKTEEGAAGATA